MKILNIIEKIDNNGIFVPAFQREFVWKREHAKALINSLIKGYPTGTILTWETSNPPELKRADYKPEMGAVNLVLDGQQRITTLYMLLTGNIPPYYTKEEIENDIRGLYVNLYTSELEYYMKSKMEKDPFWVDITSIFTSNTKIREIMGESDAMAELKDSDPDEYYKKFDVLDETLDKIKSIKERDFPQLEVPSSASIIEAINIFDIVNSSGTKLTDAELALAQITGKWPQAREVFKKKLFELKEKGFNFNLDFVVYMLQAVIHFSGSDMKALHKDDANTIKEAWSKLEGGILDYLINLLKSRACIDSTKELSSNYNLLPLIAYIYLQPDNKLSDNQINNAINWFLLSELWQRYISQLPQKLDMDLRIIRDNSVNPFDDLRNKISDDRGRLELKADDITGRGTGSPIYKMMILAAKANGAVCWGTGTSLRDNVGDKYEIQSDHIFPWSRLKSMGYGRENHLNYKLAQELSNRALITKDANLKKSNKEPLTFLEGVEKEYPGALEKQFIPMNKEFWTMDNFEKFLEKRRMIIAEAVNDFIKNFLVTKEVEVDEINISQLISYGEGPRLEFKSTFRWDIRNSQTNKNLEKSVMKTIAAFLNTDGGQLVIGVEDNGEIYGLDSDYETLNKKNTDGFENHFNMIFNSLIGVQFRHNVELDFQKVEDKEVCLVTVEPADEPAYLKIDGIEEFYIRTGNTTARIQFSEADSYKESRWK